LTISACIGARDAVRYTPKQNCLDFLGFIRPNRDFSMGYERKNKKTDSRLKLCAKRLTRFSSPSSVISAFFLGGHASRLLAAVR
jgi:hypothetical protein